MAKLSKTQATMMLGSGASESFVIEVPLGDTIKSATWVVKGIDDKVITDIPSFSGEKKYTGVRIESDDDGLYVRSGDSPVYVLLRIVCKVTVKPKKGMELTETLIASIDFKDEWGGFARTQYPYPDNYEVAWTRDKQGKRAVVLLHELIALLPEEFRKLAGAIPIIRTRNKDSWRGGEFRGAHWPFLFDTIQISDKLVSKLELVPAVTAADIEFVAVVLHEIAHAATYRNCLWQTHQAMADIRKFLRKPVAPAVTWWPAAALTVPTTLFALAQQLIGPRDIVSDFSEVAGWELDSWLARAVRMFQIPTTIVDFSQWLWRIPSEGMNQDRPIRPNVVVGNKEFGHAFGLQARGTAAESAGLSKAGDNYNSADAAFKSAKPPEKKIAQARLDKARIALEAARATLEPKAIARGFVSDYATSDALEDMAETLTFYLMDSKQLAMIGEYYGDPANPTLKAKRKFFADSGYLPKRTVKPVTIGSFWRGRDTADHLDKWTVDL